MSLVQIQMLIENVVVLNRFTCAAYRLVIMPCYLFNQILTNKQILQSEQLPLSKASFSNCVAPKISVTVQSKNNHFAALDTISFLIHRFKKTKFFPSCYEFFSKSIFFCEKCDLGDVLNLHLVQWRIIIPKKILFLAEHMWCTECLIPKYESFPFLINSCCYVGFILPLLMLMDEPYYKWVIHLCTAMHKEP